MAHILASLPTRLVARYKVGPNLQTPLPFVFILRSWACIRIQDKVFGMLDYQVLAVEFHSSRTASEGLLHPFD